MRALAGGAAGRWLVVAAVMSIATKSWAVDTSSCSPITNYNAWVNNGLVGGAASAPAPDTPFIPPGRPALCASNTRACGRVYFAKGTTLYSFEDRGTAGVQVWTWILPGALMGENSGTTINNFPSPVPGDSLHPLVVYVGGADGRLYKLDGQSNCTPPCTSNLAPLLTADLRRKDANGALICNIAPGDGINATPAVLLNAYSGSTFQNFATAQGHAGADLVFAMTFDGCGDTTHNAVHALWSDNFQEQWIFQGTDTGDKVDAFTEGCYIRYERGPRSTCGSDYTCADPNDPVLFCGTLQKESVTGQDSVFNLNVLTTSANKRVIWSANAGSVSSRPMLEDNATLGQRLYVASQGGTLFAYGPDGNGLGGPDIKWSYAAAPGSAINRSPWIEPRGGTFKDKILVLDSAGVLRAFQDNGTSTGPALWARTSSGTASWVSLPIVLPGTTSSFAYVGRNDGFLQQVDLASGDQQGRQQVDNAGSAFVGDLVFDPSLDLQDSATFIVNRAYVVDDGSATNHALKRFKLPFCNDSGGSGVGPICTVNVDGTNDCTSWTSAGTLSTAGAGYNPCIAISCDTLSGNTCEWAHSVPKTGSIVVAPDGMACDDGFACTSASPAPAPISCTTNDDCPHADVTFDACSCAGGNANACALISQGAACATDADCTDPGFPRCNTNPSVLRCEALCPATTTAVTGQTLPTTTLNVATTLGMFPPSGTIQVTTTNGIQVVSYTGVTSTSFTGCSGGTGSTTLPPGTLPTVAPGAVNTTVTGGGTLPMSTITVADTTGYPSSGAIDVASSSGSQTVWCTGKTATTFTGCSGGTGTVSVGAAVTLQYNVCANCTPRVVRTYFMKCVSNQCKCNEGAGVNCNDVCVSGVCTGANTTSCQCLMPGDRACAAGSTCCGANNGSCIDLNLNPQHCGACNTDCGTYTVPVSTSVSSPSNGQILSSVGTVNVLSTSAFPSSGALLVSTNAGVASASYTGTTATSFTGVTSASGGVLGTGGVVLPSTATACTSNNDCTSCSNDGACQSVGINSKCEDIVGGTGHCGKCSVDCSCFFSSDCASKGYNGASCTGAVFPTTLGTCTGGTPACAGYCKRLVGTGVCQNGICASCGGSGSCACDFPSSSELQGAMVNGMSGLAFERITGSSPQVCGAYVSTYNDNIATQNTACTSGCDSRTVCVGGLCRATGLDRIVKGGTITKYSSNDFHPLHGVAVPMSGWDVDGNFIATTTSSPPPGMAERGNGATTYQSVVSGTALPATGADAPFHQAKLNDGMVGPALDYTIFTDSAASTHQTYFGNFNKVGDLVKATFNGSTWTSASVPTYIASQVSCGGGCGTGVFCDSPSSGHPSTCSVSTTCSASGTASTCVAGHCRCASPQTCDATTGTCTCVAPAACNGTTCACPGAGETCSGGVCTCTADSNCASGQSCINGRCAQRVSAIAVGEFSDPSKGVQRRLVVGHGSILSIIDLATGAQTDVNLATCYVPAPSTNQATVNGILGIAVHPLYGDVLVEVKGTNNFRYLLNVDAGDNSCRHELTVQRSLQHSQNPTTPVPVDFGSTGDGYIVFLPDATLLRFEILVNGLPANFAVFKVSK